MIPSQRERLTAHLHRLELHPDYEYAQYWLWAREQPANGHFAFPSAEPGWETNGNATHPVGRQPVEMLSPGIFFEENANYPDENAYYLYWRRQHTLVERTDEEHLAFLNRTLHAKGVHPDCEYQQITVPIQLAALLDRFHGLPIGVMELVMDSAEVFREGLLDARDGLRGLSDWLLNAATDSGGFTLTGHTLTLQLYRVREGSS